MARPHPQVQPLNLLKPLLILALNHHIEHIRVPREELLKTPPPPSSHFLLKAPPPQSPCFLLKVSTSAISSFPAEGLYFHHLPFPAEGSTSIISPFPARGAHHTHVLVLITGTVDQLSAAKPSVAALGPIPSGTGIRHPVSCLLCLSHPEVVATPAGISPFSLQAPAVALVLPP